MDIYTSIDELLLYAQNNLYLDDLDVSYVRNKLLSLIGLTGYHAGSADEDKVEKMTEPGKLLDEFVYVCNKDKYVDEKNNEDVKAKVMKILSAKPSKINLLYQECGEKDSKKAKAFLMEYIKASNFGSYSSAAFTEGMTDDGISVMATETEGSTEEALFSKAVDNLVSYAENYLLLDSYDEGYVKREVFDLFGAKNYVVEHDTLTDDEITADETDRPDALLLSLVSSAKNAGLNVNIDTELLKDKVMGIVSLLPSELDDALADFSGKKEMEFLYDYSEKNYFVKKTEIEKNIHFKTGYIYRDVEVIINKNEKEMIPSGLGKNYPECHLCSDAVGYDPIGYGNKRGISLELDGEEFDWSFLPYGYAPRYGVAAVKEHGKKYDVKDMILKLTAFTDAYPSFFAGCDAQIGGCGSLSVNHQYFTAGEMTLPLQKAKTAVKLEYGKYPLAEISVLDWCTTAIRVVSQSKKVLGDICSEIISAWEDYSNPDKGIISKDSKGQHNGAAYLVRKNGGKYSVDIVLRSNITSSKYPDGIFNIHPENSIIKTEESGLLDVNGLFALPGRAELEIKALKECLANQEPLPDEISSFKKMYDSIIKENGKSMTKVEAGIYIKGAFCTACQKILENIAVFKKPEETAEFLTGLETFKIIK